MSDLVEEAEIDKLAKKIPEWELDEAKKKIFRVIEFDEFMDGIDFVDGIAEIAEEAEHHPEINILWCTITLTLTTHDQGGLTDFDFDLAKKIDTLID